MSSKNNAMTEFFKEIEKKKIELRKDAGKGIIGSSSIDFTRSKTNISTDNKTSPDISDHTETEIPKTKVNSQENYINKSHKRNQVRNIMTSKPVQEAIKKMNVLKNKAQKANEEEETEEIEQEVSTDIIKEEEKDPTITDSMYPSNMQNSKGFLKQKTLVQNSKELLIAKLPKKKSLKILNIENKKDELRMNKETKGNKPLEKGKNKASQYKSQIKRKKNIQSTLENEVEPKNNSDNDFIENNGQTNEFIDDSLENKTCELNQEEKDNQSIEKNNTPSSKETSENKEEDSIKDLDKSIEKRAEKFAESVKGDFNKLKAFPEKKDKTFNNVDEICHSKKVDKLIITNVSCGKDKANYAEISLKTEENSKQINDQFEQQSENLSKKINPTNNKIEGKMYSMKDDPSNYRQPLEKKKNKNTSNKHNIRNKSKKRINIKKEREEQLIDCFISINETSEGKEFDEESILKKYCNEFLVKEEDKELKRQKILENKLLDRTIDLGIKIGRINKKYYQYSKEEIILKQNETIDDIPFLDEFGEVLEKIGDNKYLWTKIDVNNTKEYKKNYLKETQNKQRKLKSQKKIFMDEKKGELGIIYNHYEQSNFKTNPEFKYQTSKMNIANNLISKYVTIENGGRYEFNLKNKENPTATILNANRKCFCQIGNDKKQVSPNSLLTFSDKKDLFQVIFTNELGRESNMNILLQYRKSN